MADESQSNISQLIKEYVKIDDELTNINKTVKEIRKKRTDHEEKIKKYMIENGVGKVDLGSTGSLKISKTKQNKKVNKKLILDILLESLDHEKANTIAEEIFDNSGLDEITKLERKK